MRPWLIGYALIWFQSVWAAAPTPAELIAFDQTISAQAARSELDANALRTALMPDQTALNKREWLLQSAASKKPDLAYLAKSILRLDYLGSQGVGERCESALTITPDTDLQTQLAAVGDAKATLWLRIHPRQDHHLAITSLDSAVDTVLSVYARCGDDFIAKSDDYVGLQAIAALPKGDSDLFVKAENLGSAGALRLRTILAATVSGAVTRRDNGAPIPNEYLRFFLGSQSAGGDAVTGQNGTYVFSYLGDGTATLFARTNSNYSTLGLNYADRGFDDVLCDEWVGGLNGCAPQSDLARFLVPERLIDYAAF
jgi:hypothetical protein